MEKENARPTVEQLRKELEREVTREKWDRMMKRIFGTIIVIAAVAGLLIMLLFPVLKINGDSMAGTLHDKDIVVALNAKRYGDGDIIAFFHGNDILIRRVIAISGEMVSISADGTVSVNGEIIDEPYIDEKVFGDCDIEFPYQVPEGAVFVLADKRDSAVDSRSSAIGCVSKDDIVGKMLFRVWPFDSIGNVSNQ